MKTGEVLQAGGGNIGRALIGDVMHRAGFHITFADVNEQLIQSVTDQRGYPLKVVSSEGFREEYIDDIEAISSLDEPEMIKKIVSADIITTAVGVNALHLLAPVFAKGLMARIKQRPYDEVHVAVIACENIENNTETLRDHILAALPSSEWRTKMLSNVSFPNCVVDRIVPNTPSAPKDPLATVTEDYFQLAVDKNGLLADMPNIPGIDLVDDIEAVLSQKLFTLNGSHAAVAYWGYIKGCESIEEAMRNPSIASLAEGLMTEVGAVILKNFPSISAEQQDNFSKKTLRRFKNPYLRDEPQRVGRDPKRKLAPNDRLLRPAILTVENGDVPANLNMAIVGGFRFDNITDPQATEVQRGISQLGIDATVIAITGLQKSHSIVQQTVAGYHLAELAP